MRKGFIKAMMAMLICERGHRLERMQYDGGRRQGHLFRRPRHQQQRRKEQVEKPAATIWPSFAPPATAGLFIARKTARTSRESPGNRDPLMRGLDCQEEVASLDERDHSQFTIRRRRTLICYIEF